MNQPELEAWLRQQGFEPLALQLFPGGKNNQVYRVETPQGPCLLKAYFRHSADLRERAGTEFSFSSFAWQQGIRCIPQPLACDRERQLALYRFVDGRPCGPEDVTPAALAQAQDFFAALNRWRAGPAAQVLPPASEACFSLQGHLDMLERRMARLQAVELEPVAHQFVSGHLAPAGARARERLLCGWERLGLNPHRELSQEERCLSPSDFGFHNALVTPTGLVFIDFEYAGWDEPAKTVGDFFGQVQVPVPLEYLEGFAFALARLWPDPDAHLQRMALLFELYQLKWICIVLNTFLPVGSQRRRFSASPETRQIQLDKANQLLQQLVQKTAYATGVFQGLLS